MLTVSREVLGQSDFIQADLEQRLNQLLATLNQKPVILFSLIRIATTQAPASPALADTLAVLGKETVIRRIDTMLASL
jgi:glutamyl/glutaminyl-tRNA synthetase